MTNSKEHKEWIAGVFDRASDSTFDIRLRRNQQIMFSRMTISADCLEIDSYNMRMFEIKLYDDCFPTC